MATVDEALVRIEWKLNAIMHALIQAKLMAPTLPQMVEGGFCPVCQDPIRYSADLENEQVRMSCGCDLPLRVVPGISELFKSPSEEDDGKQRQSSEADSGERSGAEAPGSTE